MVLVIGSDQINQLLKNFQAEMLEFGNSKKLLENSHPCIMDVSETIEQTQDSDLVDRCVCWPSIRVCFVKSKTNDRHITFNIYIR